MLLLFRLLLALAIVGAGYRVYVRHERATTQSQDQASVAPAFDAVPMPDGTQPNTVYIYAALNCPQEAAQRAEALAAELTRMGVPNVRANSWSFHWTSPPTKDQVDALNRVMQGVIPPVFVNGYAKANPTAEEVIAMYRSSSR